MANDDIIIIGFLMMFFGGLGLVAPPMSNLMMWIFNITLEKLAFICVVSVLCGIASLIIGITDKGSRTIYR